MQNDTMSLMNNDQSDIGYSLSEEDIDKVLHYMQIHDPEHASPERAVRFLVTWKKNLRDRDISSPAESELVEFYSKFIEQDLKNSH